MHVLYPESIVSEIYFELASILKNQGSIFRGFTVFTVQSLMGAVLSGSISFAKSRQGFEM